MWLILARTLELELNVCTVPVWEPTRLLVVFTADPTPVRAMGTPEAAALLALDEAFSRDLAAWARAARRSGALPPEPDGAELIAALRLHADDPGPVGAWSTVRLALLQAQAGLGGDWEFPTIVAALRAREEPGPHALAAWLESTWSAEPAMAALNDAYARAEGTLAGDLLALQITRSLHTVSQTNEAFDLLTPLLADPLVGPSAQDLWADNCLDAIAYAGDRSCLRAQPLAALPIAEIQAAMGDPGRALRTLRWADRHLPPSKERDLARLQLLRHEGPHDPRAAARFERLWTRRWDEAAPETHAVGEIAGWALEAVLEKYAGFGMIGCGGTDTPALVRGELSMQNGVFTAASLTGDPTLADCVRDVFVGARYGPLEPGDRVELSVLRVPLR